MNAFSKTGLEVSNLAVNASVELYQSVQRILICLVLVTGITLVRWDNPRFGQRLIPMDLQICVCRSLGGSYSWGSDG